MTAWLTMWRAWRKLTTRALSAMAAKVADTQPSIADASATSTHNPAAKPALTDSSPEAAMDVVVITDDTTRAELEEAMTNVVATLHRMPAHWTDRRASLHAKLDAMLADWEAAGV